jgi:hypothetical protein
VRGRFLVLSLLVACYGPTPPAGAPCAANGACPAGLVCTMSGVCALTDGELPPPDAPSMAPDGSIGSPGDVDGDGALDEADNCPMASNADQADEDHDTAGDACDLCPQLAGNAADDSDGDGIGDACDPNPTPDTVWVFDGFHHGKPGWVGDTSWTAADDKLGVSSSSANGGEFLIMPVARSGRVFDNYSLSATVTIVQSLGSGMAHGVGFAAYEDTSGKGVYCELHQGGSNDRYLLLADDNNALLQMPQFIIKLGSEYLLTFTRHGTSYACSASGPEGTKMLTGTSTIAPGADIELNVFGTNTQLGSVFVVGP